MTTDVRVSGRLVGYTAWFEARSDIASYSNRAWCLTQRRMLRWLDEQKRTAHEWQCAAEERQ